MTRLKVGITGGIGSGKTTVCKIFETLGVPIYYADDRAKALMIEDKELVENVKKLFGENAYFEDGSLNRKYISDLAFQNPELLQKLNGLVHPAVLKDGNKWHTEQVNVPYTLKEAALMYESDSYKYLDKIITVLAPKELRLERAILRGGGALKKEDIEARMDKQMQEEEKLKRADFVIFNDGNQALIPQVLKIHKALLNV
jgi:dephospho-CoA kinase